MKNHAEMLLWKITPGPDKKWIETQNFCFFKGRLEDRWSKKNEITDLRVRLENR